MSSIKLIVKNMDGVSSIIVKDPTVRIETEPDNQHFDVTVGNNSCVARIEKILNIENNFSVIERIQDITGNESNTECITLCYDDEQDKAFVVSGFITVEGFTKISPIVKSGWIDFRDYINMIGKDLIETITK